MENTSSVNSITMKQPFTAPETKSTVAPIQHQKQGFFQASTAGNTLTANTYNANGELPKIQTAASSDSEFNRTF